MINVNFKLNTPQKRKFKRVSDEKGTFSGVESTLFSRNDVNERSANSNAICVSYNNEVYIEMIENRIADIKAKRNVQEHELVECE